MEFEPYTALSFHECLALFELNCPVFFADEEREDYRRYLETHEDVYLLGYDQGSLVCCFGIADISEDVSSLTWIMVHPDYHRAGYGKEMMAFLLAYVEQQSKQRILVSTSQHAEAFFARYGATRLDFTADGWGKGMHRIDMEISLAQRES